MPQDSLAENSALLTVVFGLLVAVGGIHVLFQSATNGLSTTVANPGTVQVVGSETMRPMIEACAEAFMATRPDADIIVRGGGTGDGIASILHGIGDVAMASRQLDARENEFARSKGLELISSVVALDGIALIVHKDNPVRALSLAQIQDIFMGAVKDWRAVGGPSTGITLALRAAGSGTGSLFAEKVLLGRRPLLGKEFATNEEIVAEVARDVGAIGYTGLGALRFATDKVAPIGIVRDHQETAVLPDKESIRSGLYPLTRQLLLVASGPMPASINEFVGFCSGGSGRTLVERSGYLTIGATP